MFWIRPPKLPKGYAKYKFVREFLMNRAKSGNFSSVEVEVALAFKTSELIEEGMEKT